MKMRQTNTHMRETAKKIHIFHPGKKCAFFEFHVGQHNHQIEQCKAFTHRPATENKGMSITFGPFDIRRKAHGTIALL